MKYRIILAREHLLYQLFNRQFVLSLIWGSYILYAVLFYNQIENLLNGFMFPVLCSVVVLFTYRHYGKILMGICSSKKEIVLTMRGIYSHKLRKMSNREISELFQKDFQEYISNGKIKRDIVINTHALYAQGVLNLVYARFGTDEEQVKITAVAKEKGCVCNGVEIVVEEQGKHINHMEAIKIPLTSEQKKIEQFFGKKRLYYRIRIPKELFR